MTPINCLFCQQPCQITGEDKTRKSYSYSQCTNCQVEYAHFDGRIHYYSVETIYRHRFYAVHVSPVHKEYSVKVRVFPPSTKKNVPWNYNKSDTFHRTILRLEYDPKVTPQNIQDKIKTLLNFS